MISGFDVFDSQSKAGHIMALMQSSEIYAHSLTFSPQIATCKWDATATVFPSIYKHSIYILYLEDITTTMSSSEEIPYHHT